MERRQIRELIGRFLHNDVPGELQTQFRRWMLQPGDGESATFHTARTTRSR